MFERYTEKARRSIFFARYEASEVGSPQIGTEHLLLGLVRESRRLLGPNPPVDSIRQWIQAHTAAAGEKISTSVDLPLNEECRHVLAWSADEADRMGHEKIATGHLLLGLMDQEGCLGAEALREHGFTADVLRDEVAKSAPDEGPAGPVRSRFAGERAWGTIASLFGPGNRKAAQIYFLAQSEARKMGSPCVETKHLLIGVLQKLSGSELFFGANPDQLRARIKPEPPRREKVTFGVIPPTDELREALGFAIEEAAQFGHKELGAGHLVLGLLRQESCEAAEIMRENGLSLEQARRAIAAAGDPGSSSSESKGSHYV
jgi:ATP-dependent Clp protease ATP-binding subunit ClpA